MFVGFRVLGFSILRPRVFRVYASIAYRVWGLRFKVLGLGVGGTRAAALCQPASPAKAQNTKPDNTLGMLPLLLRLLLKDYNKGTNNP